MSQSSRIEGFSRLCVSLLIACFCAGPIALLQRIAAGWDGFYLVFLCGLVGLEASFTTDHLARHNLRGWKRWGVRLGEGLAILVLVIGAGSISQSPQFDGLRVAQLLIVALAWWLGRWSVSRLRYVGTTGVGAISPLRDLAHYWTAGAACLTILAALVQPNVFRYLRIPFQGSSPDFAAPAVIAYVAAAAALFTRLRWDSLCNRWRERKANVHVALAGSVFLLGGLFLTLALAFSLGTSVRGPSISLPSRFPTPTPPRGGPHGDNNCIGGIRNRVVHETCLPGGRTPPRRRHVGRPRKQKTSESPGAYRLVFLVAAGAMVLALIPVLIGWLRRRAKSVPRVPTDALRKLIRMLARILQHLLSRARARVSQSRRNLATRYQRSVRRLPMLGRQSSAADRVKAYYLATMHRASKTGLVRRPSATPAEFEVVLSGHVPEAKPDFLALTQAYCRAKYSSAAPSSSDAELARNQASRLRRLLRQRDLNQKDNGV